MSALHEGGCVCGSVRYVTEGDPMRVVVCHCTWCQRRTGSAFSVEPVFGDPQLRMNDGPLTRYRHVSDESARWLELQFCPTCGTNIGLTLEWRPGITIIDAGTFDHPGWIRADKHRFRHIFLHSAQAWSRVPEGAETFEKHFAT